MQSVTENFAGTAFVLPVEKGLVIAIRRRDALERGEWGTLQVSVVAAAASFAHHKAKSGTCGVPVSLHLNLTTIGDN